MSYTTGYIVRSGREIVSSFWSRADAEEMVLALYEEERFNQYNFAVNRLGCTPEEATKFQDEHNLIYLFSIETIYVF